MSEEEMARAEEIRKAATMLFLTLHGELWASALLQSEDIEALKTCAALNWIELQKAWHQQFLRQLARISAPQWPEWPQRLKDEADRKFASRFEALQASEVLELTELEWEEPDEDWQTWVLRSNPLFLEGPRDDDSHFEITRTIPKHMEEKFAALKTTQPE